MDIIDTNTLFDRYTQYFIEDFATRVYGNVKGTNPIDMTYLKEFITFKTDTFFSDTHTVNTPSANAATRFIQECVDYVEEYNLSEPFSRDTWKDVSELPSLHHDQIAADIYASSVLYLNTLDQTLFGVVLRDTENTVKSIRNAVQNFYQASKSGGNLHIFNWGLLNDGMWLNGALLKAFDKTNAFRAGEPMIVYYAKLCYDYAMAESYEMISDGSPISSQNLLDLIISNAPLYVASEYENISSRLGIHHALDNISELKSWITYWQSGFSDPEVMVDSIGCMSSLIRILQGVKETGRELGEESSIPSEFLDRIDQVIDIISLCLVAYEALRESQFNDTLILFAKNGEDDNVVQVYVNEDLLDTFYRTGHTDSDLVKLGTYVAEKSTINPSNGWSLSWALSRRDDIVAEVMSGEAERQEMIDNQTNQSVKKIIAQELASVVMTYLETKDIDVISKDLTDQIVDVARQFVNDKSYSLDEGVFSVLINSTGNDFVGKMANKLVANLSSEAEDVRKYARALTIVEQSIDDIVDHIYNNEPMAEAV